MMLVMLQRRMRALPQHITKTHQGSVNNVVHSLTPLVELCKTRRRNLFFIGQEFLKLVCIDVSLLCTQNSVSCNEVAKCSLVQLKK